MKTYVSQTPLRDYCNVVFNKVKRQPLNDKNNDYLQVRSLCITLLRQILKKLEDGIIDIEIYNRIFMIMSRIEENVLILSETDISNLELILMLLAAKDDSSEPLNSNKFYNKRVEELQREMNELEKQMKDATELRTKLHVLQKQKEEALKEVKLIQEKLKDREKQTLRKSEEIDGLVDKNNNLRNEIASLTAEIDMLKNQEYEAERLKVELSKYKQELLESTKRDDAILSWNSKIKNAFKALEDYTKPINDEHIRLNDLYVWYKYLTFFFLIAIFLFEILIVLKISKTGGYPSWKDSIIVILPIPVLLGLLWGFVTQMNRAQRQLVILAKQIHEIKYTEGLLLTLNTLSIDVNESMSKINEAINKLVDNHLNTKIQELNNEDALLKEDRKDSMPYEKVEKIVKAILEGVKP